MLRSYRDSDALGGRFMAYDASKYESDQPSFFRLNQVPLIFIVLGALSLVGAIALTTATDQHDLDFKVESLDGGTITLSQFRGNTVAVNFWATWCAPCRQEMPALDAYYQEHKGDEDFVLLSINTGESADAASNFVKQYGFSFPVGLDPSGGVKDQLGISGLPVTLIIDPSGKITYRHVGMITIDLLHEKVLEALN
jgi:thiol-disulfide isomerase/thioredoxin